MAGPLRDFEFVGGPLFAGFAKGGGLRRHSHVRGRAELFEVLIDKNQKTHPCRKRKDGAPGKIISRCGKNQKYGQVFVA